MVPSRDPLLEIVTEAKRWRGIAESVVAERAPLPCTRDEFGTYWVTAGHHLREQIADDRLLASFLRVSLPPYAGGSVTLFRGENLDRWHSGNLGFAWSSNIDVARMFGRGLNAIRSGGVLLRATLELPAVISGPNDHSSYLGENQFTVDPFAATGIQELEVFPSIE